MPEEAEIVALASRDKIEDLNEEGIGVEKFKPTLSPNTQLLQNFCEKAFQLIKAAMPINKVLIMLLLFNK